MATSNDNSFRVLFDRIASVYLKKYIYIVVLEMASPGKQHCASCIGTLSLSLQCALSVCLYLLGSQKLFSSAVCPYVCLSVCVSVCALFAYRLVRNSSSLEVRHQLSARYSARDLDSCTLNRSAARLHHTPLVTADNNTVDLHCPCSSWYL